MDERKVFGLMEKANRLREEILNLTEEYWREAFGGVSDFRPGEDWVRYSGRVFGPEEVVNLVDSSLDFWLTAGRFHEDFEARLAEILGSRLCLAVNSGSSANLVALYTLTSPRLGERRIMPGDEVITVAAGFPTTVNPILQSGAVPVFVDVELGTYVPSLESISAALGPKTKAVMIAHTMGVPYDLTSVAQFCKENNLWLVEDNCDALGSTYDGQLTGTFGDLSTLSFYPAHHITTGEGGAVMVNNPRLSRIARSFRDWGRDCYCEPGENAACGNRFGQQFGSLPPGYDHKFVYSHVGFNLKMTDMQAAVGVAQLEKLDSFTTARKDNHARLGAVVERHASVIPHTSPVKADPSWFGYILTMREDAGMDAVELARRLESRKIETRRLFSGNLLRHPAYAESPHRVVGGLANTDVVTNNSLFIGVFPGMTDEKMSYVEEVLDEVLEP